MTTPTSGSAGAIQLVQLSGHAVMVCPQDGRMLSSEADAAELVGAAWEAGAAWIAVPAPRFDSDFWRLSSGLAGGFIQKIVTYHLRLAILGAPPEAALASAALSAFIAESNRGDRVWFVGDLPALERRLSAF